MIRMPGQNPILSSALFLALALSSQTGASSPLEAEKSDPDNRDQRNQKDQLNKPGLLKKSESGSKAAVKSQVVPPSRIDGPTADTFPESELDRLTAAGLGRFSQGDFVGAVAEFSNALKINAKRGSLYLQRGLAYLELDEYQKALEDLDSAYELDKSNRLAILVCRGRALTGLKKYDLALADLNEAIKDDPKFPLAFISRADTNLCKGDDEKALLDLEEALSLDPKQAKAYFLRARYYKKKNKSDKALEDFSTAIKLDSSFLEKNYLEPTDQEKEMRDHFARTLKLGKKPDLTARLIERGLAAERNGEYMEAIREFTDAIGDAPGSIEAYRWRASVYMHMAHFDKAINDLSKAIEDSPSDPELYAQRAKAYLVTGSIETAIKDYTKAIEVSKSAPATLFEARGLAYSRLGRSEEAIKDFSKSIEVDPQGSTAYADRGLEHLVRKQYEEARNDFSSSIEKGQDLAISYKFRGQCKSHLGDKKSAIADLEKAAQLYKNQNDLFGCKQVEKLIADLKGSVKSYSTQSKQS